VRNFSAASEYWSSFAAGFSHHLSAFSPARKPSRERAWKPRPMSNPNTQRIAEHYFALAHNGDMNLLQAGSAKSGEIAAWNTTFAGRDVTGPYPPPPQGTKTAAPQLKVIKMNDIER
jgi:hypothetical protein